MNSTWITGFEDYSGPVKCFSCSAMMEVKSAGGEIYCNSINPPAVYESKRSSVNIPSSVDAEAVHWLIYSYFIDTGTGKAFAISPVLDRTVRKIYRAAHGRHFFVPKLKPAAATLLFFLAGLADSCLRPMRIRSFIGMLAAGVGGIRFHFIVIQTPPEVDEAGRLIGICYHCPDATVRNGRLMPVCLADHISPLDGSPADPSNQDMAEAVCSHMGETRRMGVELGA